MPKMGGRFQIPSNMPGDWRGLVQAHSRRLVQITIVAVFTLFFLVAYSRRSSEPAISDGTRYANRPYPPAPQAGCDPDIATLKKNGLTGSVEYARIEIEAVFTAGMEMHSSTTHVEKLSVPLPANRTIRIDEDVEQHETRNSIRRVTCGTPIRVKVPKPAAEVDASHLVIGVATTVERLEESLDAWSHWGASNGAKIYVLLEPHKDMSRVQDKARAMGMDITVTESRDGFDDRYFALIQHLYTKRSKTTQWAVVIDDDTFFLSMANLIERLKEYNHKKPVYLGGTSEDIVQMARWGWMAFGGAGVFLSMPMMEIMNAPGVYDTCYQNKKNGDQRIAWCVYAHTIVKLSVDPDLRQLDLRGDHAGFYESGRPQPISVHHWKSWYHHDMVKLAAVSDICGDACLLKRWKFTDGWYLTNGFSVVKYSQELPEDNISMERTWANWEGADDSSYDHTLAPIRPPDEHKISYKLEDIVVEDGQVRQFYIHKPGEGRNDRVFEVVWRRG